MAYVFADSAGRMPVLIVFAVIGSGTITIEHLTTGGIFAKIPTAGGTRGGVIMAALVSLPEWPDPSKLMFRKVDREWSEEEVLAQKGWFPLPDVMKVLDPQGTGKYRKILKQREKLNKINQDTVVLMGLKQFGNRIWANMATFNHWFRKNEAMWLDRIPKSWNFQTFLQQKNGTFALSTVLNLMPKEWKAGLPALGNLIQREEDPKTEIGADELEGFGYVVFMPRFGEWLRSRL